MVLVLVGERQHLGIDPRQDPGQYVGSQALEIDHARALQRGCDPLAQSLRVGVGGAAQAELDVGEGVGEQLAATQQPGTVGGAPELERRRPLDEGLVEIEERGPARGAGLCGRV